MSNFTYFTSAEVDKLRGMRDEVDRLRSKRGTVIDPKTQYALSLQSAMRLRVARELIAASPNIYNSTQDHKCMFRLITLDYRLKTFFENMLRSEERAPREPSQPNPSSSNRVTTRSRGRHAPAHVVDDPTSDEQSSHTEDSPMEEAIALEEDTSALDVGTSSSESLQFRPGTRTTRRIIMSPASLIDEARDSPVFENPIIRTGPGSVIDIEDDRSDSIEPEDEIIDQYRPSSLEPTDASPIDTRTGSLEQIIYGILTRPQPSSDIEMFAAIRQTSFKPAVPLFRPSSSELGSAASQDAESDRMLRNDLVDRGSVRSVSAAEFSQRSTNALETSAVHPIASASGLRSPPLPSEGPPRKRWLDIYRHSNHDGQEYIQRHHGAAGTSAASTSAVHSDALAEVMGDAPSLQDTNQPFSMEEAGTHLGPALVPYSNPPDAWRDILFPDVTNNS
ncbi:hypothetical protein BDV93DRAFT_515696 [Ceratobasidium sp. AG-I]|nr:hypothetical protein BDV93DRAFT_515696 [Ceratobasidium sp. AG-I]